MQIYRVDKSVNSLSYTHFNVSFSLTVDSLCSAKFSLLKILAIKRISENLNCVIIMYLKQFTL